MMQGRVHWVQHDQCMHTITGRYQVWQASRGGLAARHSDSLTNMCCTVSSCHTGALPV